MEKFLPTRNTLVKKRAGQEDVDSDCLFGDFLQPLPLVVSGIDSPCFLRRKSEVGKSAGRSASFLGAFPGDAKYFAICPDAG